MTELRLKYTDEYGATKRVSVDDEIFTIGRHSENDLCIPDQRLSREHVRIERFDDAFYVSDSNSSNGTTLNGARLSEAVILRNGAHLNLGGSIDIEVEIISEEQIDGKYSAIEDTSLAQNQTAFSPPVETSKPISLNAANVSRVADTNSIPTLFFWLAPVFGLIVLIFVGGLFLAFSGGKTELANLEEIPVYTPRNASRKNDSPTEENTPKPTDSPKREENTTSPTPDSGNSTPLPKTSSDVEKIEQNAASFLRRIAQNDDKAFLTSKQAEIVNSKIGQFKNSGALAENLKAVKKNSAQFESLANSKNLKAQFLATAALAKIGNNRGDPLAVANSMLPILSDLKVTLDNKLAEDNLLIIAAFDRGAAGKPRSLQSTLEALSKQTQNVSPREIRTIWFLREKDKITEAEFNFALQFIAIGAITQNPKDFNVSAEPVIFN
jgi:pSer/pThr/pTyr-binding forkhead associated (FHA) protein